MNFADLRRLQSKLFLALVASTSLLLASCGGGGASTSPFTDGQGGAPAVFPSSGSLYAGVPYVMNVTGGRRPYLITSNEPTLVDLNLVLDGNQFSFVPRNPGVIDVGLDPNAVPSRTVIIQVRDSVGSSASFTYSVLQNFFTGYRESYASTCAAASGTVIQACSGTDSIVTVFPVSNGTLYGNRVLQFDKVRGDFSFVVEDPNANPQLVSQIRRTTDHNGMAFVRLRVTNFAPTQIASYKITDVATGATTDALFTIVQQSPVDAISVLPATTFTFTGGLSTRCGTGQADVFITGGTPPYTITPFGGLAVSTTSVAVTGGRVTITAPAANPPCPQGTSVLVQDSRGASQTITVTQAPGTATPPPITVSPSFLSTLGCGQTGQAAVVGGVGGLYAISSHPNINAIVAGNTLSFTRLAVDIIPSSATDALITVTDGSTIGTLSVGATPATCP